MSASDALAWLGEAVTSHRIVDEATFAGLGVDVALDQRDSEPFDSAWMRTFNAIEGRAAEIEPSARSSIEVLRERVFLRVYELTASSDLAAYASDDFEIIAKGVALDLADAWLNALWASYAGRRFPMGDLRPVAGQLRELVHLSR